MKHYILFAIAFLGPALGCDTALAQKTGDDPEPPNVVLIISDDQAWTDYGFMGHPIIQTPNLDDLASESLVFTRGYLPTSLCRPSLASIMTGLYPHQHKIAGNDPRKGQTKAERLELNAEMIDRFQDSPRLAELLGDAGYVSHQSGKWWEGECQCGGFTEGMTHGDPERGGRHGDAGLKIGRETMQPIYDFIEGAGAKPFFIWYAPFLPHQPHNPPERLLSKYLAQNLHPEIAKYYAMCEWLDETVGDLLGYLEDQGHADNTMVIFLADNGWIQRTRDFPDHPRYFGAPRGKASPYDGGLRTPILVRWPGHVNPGRADKPVSSIDLAPTVLEAAGLDVPSVMPGLDLLDRKAVKNREAVYGSIYMHDMIDIERPAASLLYRWTVRGPWKLILPHTANIPEGEPELYNLERDPHERMNLADFRSEQLKALREGIQTWWSPN